jgi:hypothetical protein
MFKHLEDLKLLYDRVDSQGEPADDPTLVPPFIPPLRGRLTVTCFTRVGILKDMVELFGGIRFRYMDLFNVVGTRLLLDACAETLETLRLYPRDPRGKELSLGGLQLWTYDLAAVSSIRDFDLSRNKFLRTLEVTGSDIDCGLHWAGSPKTAARLLIYALSTITSPAFTEVTVIYRETMFYGLVPPWQDWPVLYRPSPAKVAADASWFNRRFEVLHVMRKVRDFRLVLCLEACDRLREYTMGVLKRAVAAEKAKRRFDDTYRDPLVIYSPRGPCPQMRECADILGYPWFPL